MSEWDELERDIGFKLPRIAAPKPKNREELFGTWSQIVARELVAYLRLANWRITKGPPGRPHSTSAQPPETK